MIPPRWARLRQHDSQYAAAALIFDRIPRAWLYCDEEGLRKEDVLRDAGAWSHGEQILVKVALDLFDPGCVTHLGHRPAHAGEIAAVLDPDLYETVVEALRLARA